VTQFLPISFAIGVEKLEMFLQITHNFVDLVISCTVPSSETLFVSKLSAGPLPAAPTKRIKNEIICEA